MTNIPPRIHRLATVAPFATMRCGLVLVDPDGERWTRDGAAVTCKRCRKLAEKQKERAE